MQQLYLTGRHASELAARLFTALNVRPAGCRLLPFTVGGAIRGEALHLLLPPSPPLCNDVPCRIRLTPEDWAIVPRALNEIAAPSLLSALEVHSPMLLDGLTGPMLACAAFREAVRRCLVGERAVVVVAADDAVSALRTLTSEDCQLWASVPDDAEERAALLETLVTEAAMRM